MSEHKIIKPGISLLSVLFVTGLLAGPAQANHDHETNVIFPLATGIVLGSMIFHGHNHNHQQYYAKRRYGHHSGHHSGHYRQDYGHRGYRQHAQSHSYGGYSRRSGHNGHQPGHGGKKQHSMRKH